MIDSTIDSMKGQRFQEHAFDKALDGRRPEHNLLQLTNLIDGDKVREGKGFQIKSFRSGYVRPVPEWAKSNEGIQKILLTAFPKLHENSKQRQKAGRWAQVIQLYFIRSWSADEVAEELHLSRNAVKMLTRSIVYTSEGKRANGTPR